MYLKTTLSFFTRNTARLLGYSGHKRFVSLGDDLLHCHTAACPDNLILYHGLVYFLAFPSIRAKFFF